MKTTIKNNRESIIEHLESLDNNEIVSIHNEYCQSCNYPDDEIYSNDEDFFNMFFENDVMGAIRATSYGEFNLSDDYVQFNGSGNLETFNNPFDVVDLVAIADDILENEHRYYDIELEEEDETDESEDDEDE